MHTHHAIMGWTPKGSLHQPIALGDFRQAKKILGSFAAPAPPNAVLIAVANLFMNGVDRVSVVRLPETYTWSDLEKGLTCLRSVPDLQSIAVPGLTSMATLSNLARAIAHMPWTSTRLNVPPPPILWADTTENKAEDLLPLDKASILVPVLPNVRTQGPGRFQMENYPASTLAGAAWSAHPKPLKGLHALHASPVDRIALVKAGAAVLIPSQGRRPTFTIMLPKHLQERSKPPEQAPRDPLADDLQEIIDNALAANEHGAAKRAVRMLTARLYRAWHAGELQGPKPEQSFRIEAVDNHNYNIWLRRPKRVREVIIRLRSGFPYSPESEL